MESSRILRMPALTRHVGLSKATIYRLLRHRRFPKPIRLGERAVGWRLEDIDEWIDGRRDN